jgi:glycine cleavage system aminomethyltransferase T
MGADIRRFEMNPPINNVTPVATQDTVRISRRRFEKSPYLEFYETPDMVYGVYAGRLYTKFSSDDPVEKYWALRRTAAMYDVPERPVEISGPDAVPFLEYVFARRISTLAEGRGRYAIACTPQGGIFMDGVLFKLTENKFWYVQPDGALDAWLIAHSGPFDIAISDPKSRVIQIQGPASLSILRDATEGAIDESMGYFQAGFFDLGGQELYVSRTGWTGELGFEIYSQGNRTDCRRLWNHLIAAGEPHGMTFSSMESMGIRRIEAGILDNVTDMDVTITPFQAGLESFIDIEKEGFIGRSALLEASRDKLLYGIKCAAVASPANATVFDNDKEVGRVTTGAFSPFLECGVGYVRFDAPSEWAGNILTLRISDSETHPCEIVDLPFYDPEKLIARGIEKPIV